MRIGIVEGKADGGMVVLVIKCHHGPPAHQGLRFISKIRGGQIRNGQPDGGAAP